MLYNTILNNFPTFLPLLLHTQIFNLCHIRTMLARLCFPPSDERVFKLRHGSTIRLERLPVVISPVSCPACVRVRVSVSACPSVYLRKKAKKQSQSRSQSRVKNLMRFGMLLGNNSWINAIWLKLISLLAFSAFSNLSGGMVRRQGQWMLGGPHLDDDADAFSGVFFDILAT